MLVFIASPISGWEHSEIQRSEQNGVGSLAEKKSLLKGFFSIVAVTVLV